MLFASFCFLCFLFETTSGILYDGKFFDPRDRIRAECVVRKSMLSYEYLGNLDKSIEGESCVPWNDVTEAWFPTAQDSDKAQKQPSESFHHSKCRTLKLPSSHPLQNLSDSNFDLGIMSGKQGPWCFLRKVAANGFPFSPAKCFEACDETKIVAGTEKKRFTERGYTILKLNYNPALLDPIDKLFSSYDFGDMKYYIFKKSREQPPQYLKLRQQVFIVLCIIFFSVIAWILTCYFLKKHSQKVHRKKQKALEEFFESTNLADIKMQADLRREREDA